MDVVDLLFKKHEFLIFEQPNKRVPAILYTGDKPVRVTRLLHRKTRNRKHLDSVIVIGNKVITRSDLFFRKVPSNLDNNVTMVWSIAELEEQDDPVAYMVSSFNPHSPDKLYRKIELGENTYLLQDPGDQEAPNLITLPKPPANAVLISIEPLLWLQFGRCRILITDGKCWLKEPITECNSQWLRVSKAGKKYRVRISVLKQIPHLPQGAFEIEPAALPTGALMRSIYNPSNLCDSHNIIYSYKDTCIQIEHDTVASYRKEYGTLVIDRAPIDYITKFMMAEGRYIPKYLLREVIG